MSKTFFWQAVRVVVMVLAVAGIIYALEFMHGGIAVWFWVALLGVGFFGLLWTFRLTQQRVARERRAQKQRSKECRR